MKLSDLKSNFINKLKQLNSGYEYDCDTDKLFSFINNRIDLCMKEGISNVVNLYIYFNNKKYHLNIWNFTLSDPSRGVMFYLDDHEFSNYDIFKENVSLGRYKLIDISDSFKIELIDFDDNFFNPDYKEFHNYI